MAAVLEHPVIVEHARPEAPRAMRWSSEEYDRLTELGFFEGRRVELIEGEILEMAAMNMPHWASVVKAPEAMRRALPGFIIASQVPLGLADSSEPEPDVLVMSQGIVGQEISKATALAHTVLVIEISDSTLTYDRTTKAALYAGANIPEYWIVNLNAREIEVLREPENGKYGRKQVLKESESIAPVAAPQASILVKDLLP